MAANMLRKIPEYLSRISRLFFGHDNIPALAIAHPATAVQLTPPSGSVDDGFLWAVPRDRRSIERRLTRKFGVEKWGTKLMMPKTTLRICNACGHYHEAGRLCPNCYETVKKETEEMQEAIQNRLGLNPIEKEVVVLYDGEKEQCSDETIKSKYIVEVKKERPKWFSRNLMQRTTQSVDSTTTTVKPSELG